jgi:SAM-dependent methyltransferase
MTTHDEQQKAWDEEHKNPTVLLQMDSNEPSGGVRKLFEFLDANSLPRARGIEMGCGKGRNVIWLAEQGIDMIGFDFAPSAIAEAKRRAMEAEASHASFEVADATKPWPWESNSFDLVVDCFASTDIESLEGRRFATSEMRRVLKPGGVLLAYLLSTDDEFHKGMIERSPAGERNAFLHPTGKFEKTYDEQDIAETFSEFEIVAKERVKKTAEFGGREYACDHFWIVFRKRP